MKTASLVSMLPLMGFLALPEAQSPPPLVEPATSPAPPAVRAFSSGYTARVAARLRPNITYAELSTDNPVAEVEVTLADDGTITSFRLTRESGRPKWDEAVLRAVRNTPTLPRDVDGRVPPVIRIAISPHAAP